MDGGLYAATIKRSYTNATQTIQHLPPEIIDLDRLDQLCLLLSTKKMRALYGHLTLRVASWTVLKRTQVLA
jgi:hypothetical protein